MNLVFVWADDGTELKVDVPVVFKGEDVCPGLKKGISAPLIWYSLIHSLIFNILFEVRFNEVLLDFTLEEYDMHLNSYKIRFR